MADYDAIEDAVKNGRPIPKDAIDLPEHYNNEEESYSLNLVNADYEYCLGRINYLQKYILSLEQRVELLNAQIALLEAKGFKVRLKRKY